jgi:uncharacterized protein
MNQPQQAPSVINGPAPSDTPVDYPLPGFVRRRPAGLFVDLTALDSNALLHQFLDRLFAAGGRLQGGDYELIHKLLYDLSHDDINHWAERLAGFGKSPEVALAKDVLPFPGERRSLYRGWHVDSRGNLAEYYFEPIYLERVIEEPVFGSVAQADGTLPIERIERRTVSEHLPLDLDEFFASAWLSNVRFGWAVPQVKAEIARQASGVKATTKIPVAHAKEPIPGHDATLHEEAQTIHRSDAPKIRNDGRVDLTQFSNRFPQVSKGTRLLKKVPCTPGLVGYNVGGQALPPPPPKDFLLEEHAGPGTHVERHAHGEYIVATQDGFLNVDGDSSQISITEKIINREGVNVRSTGNLSLQGDEFEEHGEVQEQRTVEGLHMTFMADVFGNIVSRGGRIVVEKHLAGGSAKSPGGVIEINGGASRALVEAPGGEVHIKYAESTTIIARKVVIERACLCDIVGEDVTVVLAEGCAIAGQRVNVESIGPRKNNEGVVVIRLPDVAAHDKAAADAEQRRTSLAEQAHALEAKAQELAALPEVKTFLMLQKKRAAGELAQMTPEQEGQLRALGAKAAPNVKRIGELQAALKALAAQISELANEAARVRDERGSQLAALACEIQLVSGETMVRTRLSPAGETPLEALSPRDLRIRLREHGSGCTKVFSGSSGRFSWKWQERKPEA